MKIYRDHQRERENMSEPNREIMKLIMQASEGNSEAWKKVCQIYEMDLVMASITITCHYHSTLEAVKNADDYAFHHFEELDNLVHFEDWMIQLVRKFSSKMERKQLEYVVSDTNDRKSFHKDEVIPSLSLNCQERTEIVESTLSDLNDLEQIVVLFYGYHHQSVRKIADSLHVSESDTHKVLKAAEKKVSQSLRHNKLVRKYQESYFPIFLVLLDYLHPEKAMEPVIPPVQITGLSDMGYQQEIIPDKNVPDMPPKKIGMPVKIGIAAAVAVGGMGTGYVAYYANHSKDSEKTNDSGKADVSTSETEGMYAAYRKALRTLYQDRDSKTPVFPDEKEYDIRSTGSEAMSYSFAVEDVTGDHLDDLILSCQYTDGVGQWIFVFDWDGSTIQLTPVGKKLDASQSKGDFSNSTGLSTDFYSNGTLEQTDCCDWSAGNGYTFYQYDKKSNYYKLNQRVVPCEEDKSGCTIHYSEGNEKNNADYFQNYDAIAYIPDDSDYLDQNKTVKNLSEKEYKGYVKKMTGDAKKLDGAPDKWTELSPENIKNLPNMKKGSQTSDASS